MRVGPGTEYPVTWVYQRRHLPFEVVDEVDAGWVHLRAHDGEEELDYPRFADHSPHLSRSELPHRGPSAT